MPAGTLLAGVVEQPLRHVLPDRVAAVQSNGIGRLDFHGPLAAAAARGSIDHSELEHKENKSRDPIKRAPKKILLLERFAMSEPSPAIRLKSRISNGVPRHGPAR